ncbi:hypothetical protein GCM10023195_34900 [Actinoallomurus liliacearum]|uniref:Transcriptional regulator SbtR-like C-terminal domain-containing protein n=1 Tax=Actinoallomurus liliacearum TaxID=1080073 RepID=A0ABP8TM73_9ACTN
MVAHVDAVAPGAQRGGPPATTALRAELVQVVEKMLAGAREAGAIRTDLDPALTTVLVGQTAYAIARAQPASRQLTDAFVTVLMDGLRPRPPARNTGASSA